MRRRTRWLVVMLLMGVLVLNTGCERALRQVAGALERFAGGLEGFAEGIDGSDHRDVGDALDEIFNDIEDWFD